MILAQLSQLDREIVNQQNLVMFGEAFAKQLNALLTPYAQAIKSGHAASADLIYDELRSEQYKPTLADLVNIKTLVRALQAADSNAEYRIDQHLYHAVLRVYAEEYVKASAISNEEEQKKAIADIYDAVDAYLITERDTHTVRKIARTLANINQDQNTAKKAYLAEFLLKLDRHHLNATKSIVNIFIHRPQLNVKGSDNAKAIDKAAFKDALNYFRASAKRELQLINKAREFAILLENALDKIACKIARQTIPERKEVLLKLQHETQDIREQLNQHLNAIKRGEITCNAQTLLILANRFNQTGVAAKQQLLAIAKKPTDKQRLEQFFYTIFAPIRWLFNIQGNSCDTIDSSLKQVKQLGLFKNSEPKAATEGAAADIVSPYSIMIQS